VYVKMAKLENTLDCCEFADSLQLKLTDFLVMCRPPT